MKKTVIIISFILALLFVWAIPINAEDVDFSQPTKQGVFLRMDDIDDFTDFINGSRSEKERTIKKLQTFDYTDEEIDKMIAFSDKVCENFYYFEADSLTKPNNILIRCDFVVDYYNLQYDQYGLTVYFADEQQITAFNDKIDRYEAGLQGNDASGTKYVEINLINGKYKALLHDNEVSSPHVQFVYMGKIVEMYFHGNGFAEDKIDLSGFEIKQYTPSLFKFDIWVYFVTALVIAGLVFAAICFIKRKVKKTIH